MKKVEDEARVIARLEAGWNGAPGIWPDWIYRAQEARAAVAKLPKTKDGVPIVPGVFISLANGPHELKNVTGHRRNRGRDRRARYGLLPRRIHQDLHEHLRQLRGRRGMHQELTVGLKERIQGAYARSNAAHLRMINQEIAGRRASRAALDVEIAELEERKEQLLRSAEQRFFVTSSAEQHPLDRLARDLAEAS